MQTTYKNAVNLYKTNYILLNDIMLIDNGYQESTKRLATEEYEVLQFYISDLTDYEAMTLESKYDNVYIGYSPLLEKYVLEVTHWGTNWDHVETTITK